MHLNDLASRGRGAERSTFGTFGEEDGAGGILAIQARFSRFRGTVQQGAVQRQETQIVQSCIWLDDSLPGFAPPAIRRNVMVVSS